MRAGREEDRSTPSARETQDKPLCVVGSATQTRWRRSPCSSLWEAAPTPPVVVRARPRNDSRLRFEEEWVTDGYQRWEALPRGHDIAHVQRSGPCWSQGAQGLPGTADAAGPPGKAGAAGAPESAVAYAHVFADGALDSANSRAVSATSLDTVGGTTDHYCLTVAGMIHTAVVTAGSAHGRRRGGHVCIRRPDELR
jgi:hypothetical protein